MAFVTPASSHVRSALVATALVASTAMLGALVVRAPVVAIAVPIAGVLVLMIAEGRIRWLVPITLVALAWGSSTLPLVSLAFILKFVALGTIAITALVWLLRVHNERIPHLPVPFGAAAAFLGLTLFAVLSSTWSIDEADTIRKSLSILLMFGASFLAVPLGLRSGIEARELVFHMTLVVAGVAAAGLILGLAGVVEAFDSPGRLQGILNNPNALGYFAAPLLPALVILTASEPAGGRRRLMLVAVGVLAIMLALSGSRAGALASITGVIVGIFASSALGQSPVAKRVLVVTTITIGVSVVAFPSFGFDVRSGATGEAFFEIGTGSLRSTTWTSALPIVAERPLYGHGFGATTIIFQDLLDPANPTTLGRTHNSYLEAAVDLGWTGMLWLLALVAAGIRSSWRLSRLPGPDRVLGTALLAGIVGGAVEGMFESGLLASGGLLAFPFWTLVALAHSLLIQATKGTPARQPTVMYR